MHFFNLRRRSVEAEVMDSRKLSSAAIERALQGLHRMNRVSFVARTIARVISSWARQHKKNQISTLDVACSDGWILRDVAKRLSKVGISIKGTGLDFNRDSISIAKRISTERGDGLTFIEANALELPLNGHQIIFSTLFLHHLSSADITSFLRRLNESEAELVVIHDLKRSVTGFLLAYLAPKIFSRSKVVRDDGERSIRAAFTEREVRDALLEAEISSFTLEHTWPCRMLIVWEPKRNQ